MNRSELISYIFKTYGAEPDYPWLTDESSAVFRHSLNRKWFALLMTVPKAKLGLQGPETVNVLNLKCDPLLIGALRREPGIFPAYHMNKEHWITVALDGSANAETVKTLVSISFQTTAPKPKKQKEARL